MTNNLLVSTNVYNKITPKKGETDTHPPPPAHVLEQQKEIAQILIIKDIVEQNLSQKRLVPPKTYPECGSRIDEAVG